MKTNITLKVIAISILLSVSSTSFSQGGLFGKLKNKVSKKLEEKAVEIIDSKPKKKNTKKVESKKAENKEVEKSPQVIEPKQAEKPVQQKSNTPVSSKKNKVDSKTVNVCVKNLESKYKRTLEAYNKVKKIIKENPTHYMNKRRISDLESDFEYFEKDLASCKEKEPNFDFGDIENRNNTLKSNFDKTSNHFFKKDEFFKKIENKSRSLKQYLSFFQESPTRYSFDIEKENDVEYSDIDFIKNYNGADNSYINDGKKYIAEMEQKLNSSQGKEVIYNRIDQLFSNSNKHEGAEKVKKYTAELIKIRTNVFENNKGLNALIKYSKKVGGKLSSSNGKLLNAVVVSEFHKQNVNKILFTSNLKLDPKKAKASDFKTDFVVGENIKAVVYLDNIYKKLYGRAIPEYTMSSSTNHYGIDVVAENVSVSDRSKSYIVFYIVNEKSNYVNNHNLGCHTCNSMNFFSDLPPRPQTIKIKFGSWGDFYSEMQKDVKGTFSIDGSDEEGLKKLKTKISQFRSKTLANVKLPKAKMRNASYERKIVSVYNAMGWDEKFKKAIITSSSWGYGKNYRGIIIYRYLNVVVTSNKDGKCQYQEFKVKQEKTGNGYGSFQHLSVGSRTYISCNKIR